MIEFAILNDGRVVSPRPIYASKQGEAAYVFARAVQRWSWDPDNASKVKPFFRLATRVELRCSNKTQRPPMTVESEAAMTEWFAAKGVRPLAGQSDAARLVELRSRQKTAPGDTPEQLATLIWLSRNTSLDRRERLQYSTEAIGLSERIAAPVAVRFVIALDNAAGWAKENSESWRGEAAKLTERLQELRGRPEFAEPGMQAVINLQIAQAAGVLRRDEDETAALNLVAQSSGLSPKHPLKVAALVQLANLYAARKQVEQAQSLYDLTGLTAKQCALVDGGPVMLRSGSGTFPMEAFNWGFEGWTSLEYDVAADGSTRNPRAVAAFPPRVFAKASEQLARTARYRVSYRPEGDLACTAMSRRVRFSIP